MADEPHGQIVLNFVISAKIVCWVLIKLSKKFTSTLIEIDSLLAGRLLNLRNT